MTVRLELPFTLDTWDVVPDEPSADKGAPATGRVVLAKTYAGDDLNGTATGHALTTRGERGASYVAQERIVGTLRGRAGSFVLEHGAVMGEGQETNRDRIAPLNTGWPGWGAPADPGGPGISG